MPTVTKPIFECGPKCERMSDPEQPTNRRHEFDLNENAPEQLELIEELEEDADDEEAERADDDAPLQT